LTLIHILTGLGISLFFLVIQIHFSPYSATALNLAEISSLLGNVLTLFMGLLLIIDQYLENAAKQAGENYDLSGRNAKSVTILLINISVGLLPILVRALQFSVLTVNRRIAKMFSRAQQNMEPTLQPNYELVQHRQQLASNSDLVFARDSYFNNTRYWA